MVPVFGSARICIAVALSIWPLEALRLLEVI